MFFNQKCYADIENTEEGFAMKNTALVLIIFGSFSLVACDTQTATEQLQLEARTMIIGGVPVHDKDYKIDETLNNRIQQK